MGVYKIKNKKIKKTKSGPERTSFTYEEAKQIIRTQGVYSKAGYEKWWNYNTPYGMPKRPDIIYHRDNGSFTWSDFLGVEKKTWPQNVRNLDFGTYEECKKFTYTLGLKSKMEWINYCRKHELPKNIPRAPQHYYTNKRRVSWISWADFLGYDFSKRHEFLVEAKRPILFVVRMPGKPFNVYKINVLYGESQDVLNLQQKTGFQIIRCFYLNKPDDNWLQIINKSCKPYALGDDDEYSAFNIAELLSDLSDLFESLR
jgi:hypothetical protein